MENGKKIIETDVASRLEWLSRTVGLLCRKPFDGSTADLALALDLDDPAMARDCGGFSALVEGGGNVLHLAAGFLAPRVFGAAIAFDPGLGRSFEGSPPAHWLIESKVRSGCFDVDPSLAMADVLASWKGAGFDVDARDGNGLTGAFKALLHGDGDALKAFLDAGASVSESFSGALMSEVVLSFFMSEEFAILAERGAPAPRRLYGPLEGVSPSMGGGAVPSLIAVMEGFEIGRSTVPARRSGGFPSA